MEKKYLPDKMLINDPKNRITGFNVMVCNRGGKLDHTIVPLSYDKKISGYVITADQLKKWLKSKRVPNAEIGRILKWDIPKTTKIGSVGIQRFSNAKSPPKNGVCEVGLIANCDNPEMKNMNKVCKL